MASILSYFLIENAEKQELCVVVCSLSASLICCKQQLLSVRLMCRFAPFSFYRCKNDEATQSNAAIIMMSIFPAEIGRS